MGGLSGPDVESHASLAQTKAAPGTSMPFKVNHTSLTIALVAVVSVLGFLAYYYWQPICSGGQPLWQMDKEHIRIWLESWGPLAPLVFILVQALQVVVPPIPGEVTGILGGFLFGVTPGFLYSTLGLTLGGTLAFLVGRWFEVHLIEKLGKKEMLTKFDFLIEREGALVAFLLFMIPGAPKDYLCIILGLSRMPLKVFLPLMGVGRMPATFLLTLQGAQVYEGNYLISVVLLILFLSLAGMLLAYRENLYRWLRNWGDTSED